MDLHGHLFSGATWQAMERLPANPLMEAPQAIEATDRPSPKHAVGRHNTASVESRGVCQSRLNPRTRSGARVAEA